VIVLPALTAHLTQAASLTRFDAYSFRNLCYKVILTERPERAWHALTACKLQSRYQDVGAKSTIYSLKFIPLQGRSTNQPQRNYTDVQTHQKHYQWSKATERILEDPTSDCNSLFTHTRATRYDATLYHDTAPHLTARTCTN
jgi:hypothetical protein